MSKKKVLITGFIFFTIGSIIFLLVSKESDIWKDNLPPSPTPDIYITSSAKPSVSAQKTKQPLSQPDINQQIIQAFESNKFEKTISLLENMNNASAEQLFYAAQSARKTIQYEKAKAFIEQALKIENTDIYRIEYANTLLSLGETEEVKGLLKNISSGDTKQYFELLLALSEEEHETAKTIATKLQNSSEYKTVSNAVLDIYTTYDGFSDASEYYLRTMVGNLFKTMQWYNIAIAHITPTVEARPDYQDAWRLLGNTYLEMKKFDLAERMFEKALSLDPTHPQSRYLLGITLAELGQWEDATEQLEAAITYNYATPSKIYAALGDISFQSEQYSDALSWYEKNLDANENVDMGILSRTVYILIEKTQSPNLALPLLQEALLKSKMEDKPEILGFKAWVTIAQGNTSEAKNILKEIRPLTKNSAIVPLYDGIIAQEEDQFETALEFYKSAYEKDMGGFIGQEAVKRYNILVEELQ